MCSTLQYTTVHYSTLRVSEGEREGFIVFFLISLHLLRRLVWLNLLPGPLFQWWSLIRTRRQACWILYQPLIISDQSSTKYEGTAEKLFILLVPGCQADIVWAKHLLAVMVGLTFLQSAVQSSLSHSRLDWYKEERPGLLLQCPAVSCKLHNKDV